MDLLRPRDGLRDTRRSQDIIPEKTLSDISTELQALNPKKVKDNPKKYFVAGKLESKGLHSFLSLQYEVSLSEQDGRFIITTGKRREAGRTEMHAAIDSHTHPLWEKEPSIKESMRSLALQCFGIKTAGTTEAIMNTPSVGDLKAAIARKERCGDGQAFLLHPDGITVYQAPPGVDYENVIPLWFDFLKRKGTAYTEDESLSPDDGYVQLMREFAIELSGIVTEARWEDERISAIVETMNDQLGYSSLRRETARKNLERQMRQTFGP